MSEPHVRWMIRRDMPEVLDIEARTFEFPWNEEHFIRCLRVRNNIGMIAERKDRVDGFMVYELHKTSLRVLNFAVRPECRREGIGKAMVDKLKSKLDPKRRNRLSLEVRETNLTGQLFFRSQGFKAVSVLRDYYDDFPEDAYVFQFRIPQEAKVEA